MIELLLAASLFVGPPEPKTPSEVMGLPAHGKSQEHPYEWKKDLLFLSTSIGGEVASMEWARSRGAGEFHPLMQNPWVFRGVKTLEIPILLLWTRNIHKNDQTGAHKVKWIVLGMEGLMTAWNIQVALRQ